MSDDKKDDKHEEGGGIGTTEIIPQKYLTPILLIIIVVGTFLRFISPGLAQSIGPMVLDPFTSILWAYALIVPLTSFMGGHKEGMKAYGGTMLIFVVALVIPVAWGYNEGIASVIAPLIVMLLLNALAVRYHKKAFGHEEKEEAEFDAAKIREYGADIKSDIEVVKATARKGATLLGRNTVNDISNFYGEAHTFGHKVMQADEKKFKKEKGTIIRKATDLKSAASAIDTEVFSAANAPNLNDPQKKLLEKLSDALESIMSKLSLISNSLSSA